ncbi:hypothetical protein SpCBS45565_g07769 [Spizellomyces sp. 'palustris']|nr:hypothetical protein SpCBS45565_g07769 [Spizellomyces sp. 'palustris']
MSHSQERIDRRMFLIRDQLKFQYRATQRAQHLEHKAADSKKRFVSYIFHEVRVPLNSALLAIQNLAGEGVFKYCDRDQREMVDALTGSLGMMAKVLNDVLDFNRMEDGKLSCTHNPFDFHKVVRSIFVSARAVAENRAVNLVTELDGRIDQLCESKVMIGDEMRLRQVLSNLTSNACKFTNSGGTVKILTRLLYPTDGSHLSVPADTRRSPSIRDDGDSVQSHRIDIEDLDPVNNPDVTIIRMEVHDTGVGIRRCDLIDNRLFSPYVQTEEGRRQGGKGTGLGLALVRHIVKLSGGRLGVQSRLGVGSVFWVELPLGLQDRSTPIEERSCFMPTLVPPNFGGTTESIDDPEMSSASKPESKTWKKVRLIVDKEERLEPYLPALAGMGSISEGDGMDIKPPYSDDSGKEIKTNGTSYKGEIISNVQEEVRVPVNGEDVVVVITSSEEIEEGIELERIRHVDEPPSPEPSSSTIGTKASPAATPEPSGPEKPEETRKLNLLVVDDDKITRRLMSRLLSRLGHKVETAEDGSIALKKLTSSYDKDGGPPFDLIFLDNQMPIMTGVECIQHIRDKGILVWACGVTGNAMREDQDEFYDAGIDRVLTKPVQEKDVREMIDIVLNLREPDNGVMTWRKKLVRTPTGGSKTDQDSTKQKGSGKVS